MILSVDLLAVSDDKFTSSFCGTLFCVATLGERGREGGRGFPHPCVMYLGLGLVGNPVEERHSPDMDRDGLYSPNTERDRRIDRRKLRS